jgi:hypothetical protein
MKKLRVLAEARQEFADALQWYRREEHQEQERHLG